MLAHAPKRHHQPVQISTSNATCRNRSVKSAEFTNSKIQIRINDTWEIDKNPAKPKH
jgi:hypothetical protein